MRWNSSKIIYLTDLIYFTAVLIYCLFIFSNFQCVFVMFFWCSAAWLEVLVFCSRLGLIMTAFIS